MKKLMIGLAAAGLCGAVFAEIQSANVVGYQKTAYTVNGGSTVCVGTFAKVDGSVVTLADLAVQGGNYGQNSLQFLKSNGSTAKFDYTDTEYAILTEFYGQMGETPPAQNNISAMLKYVNAKEAEEEALQGAGWYAVADGLNAINLSNRTDFNVSFGNGFFFKPSIAAAQLQYSGEVVQGDSTLDLPVNGGSSLSGNCSPVDFDLGYFSVAGGNYGQNSLQFLKSNGSTAKFDYTDEQYAILTEFYGQMGETPPPQTNISAMLKYVNAKEAEEEALQGAGWYAVADGLNAINLSTSFTVKSGEGFFYKPSVSASKLIIPGAID